MFEKEKNVIISWLFFILMCLFCVGVWFVSKRISAIIIGSILVVALYVYILPQFIKLYYTLHGSADEVDWTRFIPIYNELCIYNPGIPMVYTTAYIVSFIGVVASIGLTFLSPEIVGKFLSTSEQVRQFPNKTIIASFLFIALFSIVRGIGMLDVVHQINIADNKLEGIKRDSKIEKLFVAFSYILLFIPCFRALAILYEINRLYKLVKFNNLTLQQIERLNTTTDIEGGKAYYANSNRTRNRTRNRR